MPGLRAPDDRPAGSRIDPVPLTEIGAGKSPSNPKRLPGVARAVGRRSLKASQCHGKAFVGSI